MEFRVFLAQEKKKSGGYILVGGGGSSSVTAAWAACVGCACCGCGCGCGWMSKVVEAAVLLFCSPSARRIPTIVLYMSIPTIVRKS